MTCFKVERFDGEAKVDFYYKDLKEAQKHFNYFKNYDVEIYKNTDYDFLEGEFRYSFEIYMLDYEYSVGAFIEEIDIFEKYEELTTG